MPKINIYLPDDLATAVRDARLPVSPICQKALAEAVRTVGAAREAVDVLRDPDFDPLQHPVISTRITAQMTPRVRQALRRARDLAGEPGLVGSTHLLAGILAEPDGLGVQVLQSLAVDIPGLRDAAINAGGAPEAEGTPRRPRARTPRPALSAEARLPDEELLDGLSTAARTVIAAALEAAIEFGHGFLGTEHLVLALADQADGAAGELLRDAGARPESLRRAIPAALAAIAAGFTQARQMPASAVASRLDDISRRLDEFDERLRAGGL
jgi:Clp amino terminal domain, pathogenicity island component